MNDSQPEVDNAAQPTQTDGQPASSAGQSPRIAGPPELSGEGTPSLAGDMLYGADAIAAYLGMSRRRVYHAVEKGHIPVLRIGQIICARKSRLRRWISEMEAKAFEGR